jgi:hypothetical protein
MIVNFLAPKAAAAKLELMFNKPIILSVILLKSLRSMSYRPLDPVLK